MTDTETAIRHPKRGKAHRPVPGIVWGDRALFMAAACDKYLDAQGRGWTQRVPLSQVATEDRCGRCWPIKGDA